METKIWLIGVLYLTCITLLTTWVYPLPKYTRRGNMLISLLIVLMPIPGLFFYFMLHFREKYPKSDTAKSNHSDLVNSEEPGRNGFERDSSVTTESDNHIIMDSDLLTVTRQQLTERTDYLGNPSESVYHDFLLATQNMNDESAVDILKQGMRSRTESIRLLSHAFYSKRENRRFREIESLTTQLRNGQFHNPRLHIALAETYQDMINADIFGQSIVQEIREKVKLHARVLLKHKEHQQLAQRLLTQT